MNSLFVSILAGEYYPSSFLCVSGKKPDASFPRILLPSVNGIQESINVASSIPEIILEELVIVYIFPVQDWLPDAIRKAKWKQLDLEPTQRHSFIGTIIFGFNKR